MVPEALAVVNGTSTDWLPGAERGGALAPSTYWKLGVALLRASALHGLAVGAGSGRLDVWTYFGVPKSGRAVTSGRLLAGYERRCCTQHGRVLVQREGGDKRVLAAGGRYGGLAPCPRTHPIDAGMVIEGRMLLLRIDQGRGYGGQTCPRNA